MPNNVLSYAELFDHKSRAFQIYSNRRTKMTIDGMCVIAPIHGCRLCFKVYSISCDLFTDSYCFKGREEPGSLRSQLRTKIFVRERERERVLPVDVLHNVAWPCELHLQLALVFNEKVYKGACDGGRGMEEEGRDPEDGPVQLLQTEEEVVAVLDGQQVVVVLLQDAGVEGGQVGVSAHVLAEHLGRSKVAAENKVEFVNFGPTATAGQDATVAHDSTGVVALVEDGREFRQQRAEVLPDGEDILVAGVIVVHQLPDTHAAFGEGEVVRDIYVLSNLFAGRKVKKRSLVNWICWECLITMAVNVVKCLYI